MGVTWQGPKGQTRQNHKHQIQANGKKQDPGEDVSQWRASGQGCWSAKLITAYPIHLVVVLMRRETQEDNRRKLDWTQRVMDITAKTLSRSN